MILLNKKLDQSFRITFSLVFGSGGNVFYFKNTVSFVCYDTLTLDSIIVKYIHLAFFKITVYHILLLVCQ